MNQTHKRNLKWYEAKYKEVLMNSKTVEANRPHLETHAVSEDNANTSIAPGVSITLATTLNTQSETPQDTIHQSGEFSDKLWHSASSYKCVRCEEKGDYLKIYKHVSKVHGVKLEMKQGVDFRAEIEYHMCLECEAMVKCDPFFISHHLKSKHRRTLSWYESKYRDELLKNEDVKIIPAN